MYSAFTASLVLMAAAVVTTVLAAVNAPADGCDWSGSGLDYKEEERGVQPVYLRCAQGKVEWKYPRGALRVVLRHGTSGKDFKGCLKVSKGFHGARIYVEGHRTLHTLYSTGDDQRHPQLPRCFTSNYGQVALYVEAETNSVMLWGKKSVAEFSYDLQLRSRDTSKNLLDPQEDCRPCSSSELLRHFCTADFLAKGSISGIYQNDELQRTELTIRASSVLRQNAAIFHRQEEVDFRGMYGTLHVPIWCGVKHGGGEFLFVGRIMLDEPLLTCAPRIEEWEKVKMAALKDGSNQCELS